MTAPGDGREALIRLDTLAEDVDALETGFPTDISTDVTNDRRSILLSPTENE